MLLNSHLPQLFLVKTKIWIYQKQKIVQVLWDIDNLNIKEKFYTLTGLIIDIVLSSLVIILNVI